MDGKLRLQESSLLKSTYVADNGKSVSYVAKVLIGQNLSISSDSETKILGAIADGKAGIFCNICRS